MAETASSTLKVTVYIYIYIYMPIILRKRLMSYLVVKLRGKTNIM